MKFVHTADSHLGFDITRSPQSHPEGRRKRADAVYQNFETTVQHALDMEADLYIHSGDLFNKYYIPMEVLDLLVQPLLNLSKQGTRVLLIPGNHERSEFPFDLFLGNKGIFVFDRPKSLSFQIGGYAVAFAGFPFIREDSRRTFLKALEETSYAELRSDLNILVTHQAFDQATVGPNGFTFRMGRSDTVARQEIPSDFDYVAAGHIHRYQILTHPLKSGLNIVYPGSTQRMSFAEMHEDKGFIEGELMDDHIMTNTILDLAAERTVIFDGAMGTMLLASGLPTGGTPELWNLERPDIVEDIHRQYFAAGSDVVHTNTFGAPP